MATEPDTVQEAKDGANEHEVPDGEARDYPRRWYLWRKNDETGISGEGLVAWGVQFPDGVVAYRWNTSPATVQIADSVHDVQHIHGHDWSTEVRWVDE